jgi:hypothetical protein
MKLFVSLAALLIANNSFALTLPKAELNKLDGALASSLMQLSSEDACAGIKKDHDFFKEAESQIGASRAARFDSLQASTFAGTAVTGLLGLMATGGWQSAKRSYPGIAQPLLKRAKFMFSSSGALAISTGSLALFANSSVGTTPSIFPARK